MMTLMKSKVITFLVLLFMFIVGFAGTFHVWFQDVSKDDASDLEELRVDVINTLGADRNTYCKHWRRLCDTGPTPSVLPSRAVMLSRN